jgi:rhomboid protease GluP
MEERPPESSEDDILVASSRQIGPIVFGASGLEIRLAGRRPRRVPYTDITHCARSRWGYALATTGNIILLRQSRFPSGEAVSSAHGELLRRIGDLQGGAEQLERMAETERGSRRLAPLGPVWLFAGLCVLAQYFQFRDLAIVHVGSFMPSLVAQGEAWRVLTANFLHDILIFPAHILLNLVCIVSFGALVERALGGTRTLLIMGVSAVGAMWASAMANYSEVIGASGVAAGLIGAALCLELNASRCLPVWSRIPRRILIGALVVQGLVDLFVPFVAGAAHAGGFVLGYLVTRSFIDAGRIVSEPGTGARRFAGLIVVALVLAVVSAMPLLERDPEALEAHAVRVLQMPDSSARYDNETAWRMLTETKPSESGVEVAVLLALRAASGSEWSDPNVLDTLAEALFASGDVGGALNVIDQAVFLSNGHRYFIEQRRRFSGERDPEDRPAPPEEGWFRRIPEGFQEDEPTPSPIDAAEPGESAWI